MRTRILLGVVAAMIGSSLVAAQAPKRFNPMVELLAAKKPVFGLYAPSNRRGGPPGAAPAAPADPKPPAQLAKEAVDYPLSDFIFDGSMEGDFDRAFPAFSE